MYENQLQLLSKRRKLLNPKDYNIVFLGDSWVGDKGYTSNEIMSAAMEEAKKHEPLFILHGGDIVFSGSDKENFNFFINKKNDIIPELPLFVVVGNHEMDKNLTGDAAVANFKEIIGPLHFKLNIPEYKLTLIALDSLYHHEYSNYGLTKDELFYLRESLKLRFRNTITAMHVPPQTDKWIPEPGDDTFFTKGSKAFFMEVKDKVGSVLLSHIHDYKHARYKGTKLYISGGGGAALLKNALFHILVINIKNYKGGSRIRLKVIPIGRD